MILSKYPALKHTVRMKKLSNGVCIVEKDTYNERIVSPLCAYLLCFANGELTVADLAECLAITYSLTREKALDFTNKTFDTLFHCIDMYALPTPVTVRYKHEDFIFKPEKTLNNMRYSSPISLSVTLTKKCNFRCIYCLNSSTPEKNLVLNGDIWIDIFKQAKELEIMKIEITGGEPTLHPGFLTIMKAVAETGALVQLFTNGTMIDKKTAKELGKIPQLSVQVSLDSANAEVHHFLTNSENSHHLVLNGIKNLTDAGIETIVKSVYTPHNVHGWAEMLTLCEALCVDTLSLDGYDYTTDARGNKDMILSAEDFSMIQTEIANLRNKLVNTDLKLSEPKPMFKWGSPNDFVHCGAMSKGISIMSDGEVPLCARVSGDKFFSIGNVKSHSLKDIWASECITKLMYPTNDRLCETCQQCKYATSCNTGCYATKKYVNANPYDISPQCWKSEYIENPFVYRS